MYFSKRPCQAEIRFLEKWTCFAAEMRKSLMPKSMFPTCFEKERPTIYRSCGYLSITSSFGTIQ